LQCVNGRRAFARASASKDGAISDG
jgi:hypothetical protein